MHRYFIKSLILLPLLLQGCNTSISTNQKPNIILIAADDLGWSDIGCYGSEIKTPNLDRLASEGMRFTQFHNTSKCFPSRACLLTGLYAQQCGYGYSFNGPFINSITLGNLLQDAGYRTLWSGKHHGLENPVFLGFDRYYGLKDGACNYFNPGEQRPGEGKPARKGEPGNKRVRSWCIDSIMYEPYTPEAEDFYTTDYFTNYALHWLEEYRNDEEPFFLYMAYTAPHDPLMAWPEDIARYEGVYDDGYEAIRKKRYAKQQEMGLIDSTYRLSKERYSTWEQLDATQKDEEIRKMEVYAAMIDRLDQNIGRILDKLKEQGKDDNTLIMFVSDNGASAEMVHIEDDYGEIGTMTRWSSLGPDWANVSNTPFRLYKNYSYEGGINTPFIVWWPDEVKAGTFSEYPGHLIDIMPTLAAITGAVYPESHEKKPVIPMQGKSLVHVLKRKKSERKDILYWKWQDGRAVRDDHWKIVKEGLENPWELYNMKTDPTETTDLSEAHPDVVMKMDSLYQVWEHTVEGN